jgi:hypothetical protein
MLHNKKGQVGETMTWIIATIVIIVILVFSIFITSILGKSKSFDKNRKFEFDRETDLIATKSLTSYLLTKNNFAKTVFEQLNEEDNLNDFNGLLAKKIFSFYENEYSGIWLGVSKEKCNSLECYKKNDYFEEKHRKDLNFIGEDIFCGSLTELKDKNLILFLNKLNT